MKTIKNNNLSLNAHRRVLTSFSSSSSIDWTLRSATGANKNSIRTSKLFAIKTSVWKIEVSKVRRSGRRWALAITGEQQESLDPFSLALYLDDN